MRKLPNAPLLEVIFELRWNMAGEAHWDQFPFLQGDLYATLKEEYPIRESLFPIEIPQKALANQAIYRYSNENGFPMVQMGPGVLTLNTTDDYYVWEDYAREVKSLIKRFFSVYDFSFSDYITPSLSYYDFLAFNWEDEHILEFVNENLNIEVNQNFFDSGKTPFSFNWGISYKTDLGVFSLKIDKGNVDDEKQGMILQFQLRSGEIKPDFDSLNNWLDKGHALCSKMFKELTKGKLYDSFTK